MSNLLDEISGHKVAGLIIDLLSKLRDGIIVIEEFVRFLNMDATERSKIFGILKRKFTKFLCRVSVPGVSEFTVDEFFRHRADTGPRMYIWEGFQKRILDQMKGMKLSSDPAVLEKSILVKNAWDTEIQSDFKEKPIIPVKKFICWLKTMIEVQPNGEFKEDGLDNSGKANIFNVDLTEIGINEIVAVSVYRVDGVWRMLDFDLDFSDRWFTGLSFFSPATAGN